MLMAERLRLADLMRSPRSMVDTDTTDMVDIDATDTERSTDMDTEDITDTDTTLELLVLPRTLSEELDTDMEAFSTEDSSEGVDSVSGVSTVLSELVIHPFES